jgi:hypothetical protein
LALCLMYWSLRYFELERTMGDFSWPALRAELADNFDYIGVWVHLLHSTYRLYLKSPQIAPSGRDLLHRAWF